jgi:hypothetical protein
MLLLRGRELLYREGVVLVRQGFVAGQAFGLVDALLILFGSGENRVMPVFIAKKFGDVIPPADFAFHSRVAHKLIWNVEAIGARDRIVIGVELRRIHLGK